MQRKLDFWVDAKAKNRYLPWKRVLDVVVSTVALALCLPTMLICFFLVRLTSHGPAIFRQTRVGRNGRLFVCYKFRTMTIHAPSDRPASSFEDRECFVTPIGRLLRRTSLDELPQLWNVLRGDMSLIGPRPLILREEVVHHLRHLSGADRLRPGITGLAQTHGRACLPDREKASLDAYYAQTLSLGQDLRILARTLQCILFDQDGAKHGTPKKKSAPS